MKDYEETRQTLFSMLEELNERLGKITDDVKHADMPIEKDFAEQATQNENDEVLDRLGNAARTEIAMIQQAIARIDSGKYGFCLRCGGPIKPERLKIVPYSSLCVECSNKSAS